MEVIPFYELFLLTFLCPNCSFFKFIYFCKNKKIERIKLEKNKMFLLFLALWYAYL